MGNHVLSYALQYLRRGWCPIPVVPRTKNPAVSWREFQSRRPTEDEVNGWFANGSANVGLVTGAISGLVVVDLDGPDGLAEAAKRGLRSSVMVLTGKGKHLYFKHPGGVVQNAVRIAPGVDIRGDGGYVLAPPSVHPDGGLYRLVGSVATPLPLYQALPATGGGDSSAPVGVEAVSGRNGPGWIAEALSELQEGNRNNTFAKVVGRLHRDGWAPGDIKALLLTHAKAVEFPEAELDVILASITSRPRGGIAPSGKLLTAESLMALPPVNWLISGAVPVGTTTLLVGLQGIGKSLVILDTALELTRPLGRTVFGPARGGPKRVLYVDEENGQQLLGTRLRAFLAAKPGVDLSLVRFAVDEQLSVTDPSGYVRMEALVKEFKPDVVFIDSLIQMHKADENNAVAMTEVMNKLRWLRDTYGFTLVVLHHESKSVYAKEKENDEPTAGDARGSNAIVAQTETVFTMRKRDGLISLYHTKARFAEALKPRIVALTSDGGLKFSVGEENDAEVAPTTA